MTGISAFVNPINDQALTSSASLKPSLVVSTNLPASSSFFAIATACTKKSILPNLFSISAGAFLRWSSFVTSSSKTWSDPSSSASFLTLLSKGSRYENANSAPCLTQAFAIPQAIECLLATPTTNPFFLSRMPIRLNFICFRDFQALNQLRIVHFLGYM